MHLCDQGIGGHPIEIIVFDFDNVIIRGSEVCKRNAWTAVFELGSVEMDRLKEGQLLFADGKGDRFDILGHVYSVPQNVDPRSNNRVIEAATVYNNAVQRCIQNIGLASSDLQAIQLLKERFQLYIISATPEDALHTTLSQLSVFYNVDLLEIFKLALGTPKNKPENFKRIQEHSGVTFDLMLMVGDGENDYAAVESVGAQFIGVQTPENEVVWRDMAFSQVHAIDELPALLEHVKR